MLKTSWHRAAGAAVLVTVTALALGACASPSGTGAAAAKPTKTAAASADGAPCTKDNEITDDVIGLEQVKDERGVYCHVTWNPSSPDLAWDPTNVDPSLAEFGYTADEAKTARDFALTFIVEDGLDSPLADNPDADRMAWLNSRKHLMSQAQVDYFTNTPASELAVVDASARVWPAARRDGKPRADEIQLTAPKIKGVPPREADNENPAFGVVLQVFVPFTAGFYEVSDADVIASILANEPELTEESILASDPGLADGKDSGYTISGTIAVGFDGKDFTTITGTGISYELFTVSATPISVAD